MKKRFKGVRPAERALGLPDQSINRRLTREVRTDLNDFLLLLERLTGSKHELSAELLAALELPTPTSSINPLEVLQQHYPSRQEPGPLLKKLLSTSYPPLRPHLPDLSDGEIEALHQLRENETPAAIIRRCHEDLERHATNLPRVLRFLNLWAATERRSNRLEEAAVPLCVALTLAAGGEHPALVDSLQKAAYLLMRIAPSSALAIARRAHHDAVLLANTSVAAELLVDLGLLYYLINDLRESARHYQAALLHLRPEQIPGRKASHAGLAHLAAKNSLTDEARHHLALVKELTPEPTSFEAATLLWNEAYIEYKTRNFARASDLIQQCVLLLRTNGHPEDLLLATLQLAYLRRLSKAEDAVQGFLSSLAELHKLHYKSKAAARRILREFTTAALADERTRAEKAMTEISSLSNLSAFHIL